MADIVEQIRPARSPAEKSVSAYVYVAAVIVAALILSPLTAALAKPPITAGEPVRLDQVRSLGDVIRDSENGSIHIVYVHGMRAEKPGEAGEFISRLGQSYGTQGQISRTRRSILLDPWPMGAAVGTRTIWDTEKDWRAGQPFIDRYVLRTRRYNASVTVDEVNWWPLLLPLKCRLLVTPEAKVAGVDRAHLDLCFNDTAPYHRWLTPAEYNEALRTRPPLGGAARFNRYLKQQILDWGLSDAVIATGPMRPYLNATMDAAFAYAAVDSASSEYVVISESLGSFVVLDAYSRNEPSVRAVLDATHNLYFFANQFSLLELARIEGLPSEAHAVRADASLSAHPAGAGVAAEAASPLRALQAWASAPSPAGFLPSRSGVKQIVAFSDPSDALTFRVPDFENALVSNVYVRNATRWLGLFADPIKAHAGQMRNEALWRAMIRESPQPGR